MSAEIESLKQVLRTLEAQTYETRKQLQKLLQGNLERRCSVEISWDQVRGEYKTRFFRNSETLFFHFTKKYTRTLASAGIELANGFRPRVPWKEIDAGKTWTADVVIHEWYWDKNFCTGSLAVAQVIPFRNLKIAQK